MALTANIAWLHPQNWDGNPPLTGGWRKVILHLTGICNATGVNTDESDVIKLDISELRKLDGTAPTRTVIESAEWNIGGFDNIKLSWDRAPENTILVMSRHGKIEYAIVDPGEEGDRTGDLLISTVGAAVGAVYDITLCVRLK